jgi:hypothetical protein
MKSAFLNSPLSELVYVEQPPSFEDPKFPVHIYKLDKALYRLKQAQKLGIIVLRASYSNKGLR